MLPFLRATLVVFGLDTLEELLPKFLNTIKIDMQACDLYIYTKDLIKSLVNLYL